ncbi:MAG: helix-turn-helix domain-containing protein [Deltaproteobacteria bacterium]|nr:helix-turn-helix domain-containing protein [Deltaproteobacteria bacterium]
MNPVTLIKQADFTAVAEEFYAKTNLPLLLVAKDGEIIYEHRRIDYVDLFASNSAIEGILAQWRQKSIENAFRWGDAYFSNNPLGLVCFTVPIIHDGMLVGGIISGYVIFPEMADDFEFDIQRFIKTNFPESPKTDSAGLDIRIVSRQKLRENAEMLFRLVRKYNLSDLWILHEKRERSAQQLNIAYYIERIKKEHQDTARLILEKQDEIIEKVYLGDINGAKEILNEFLGYIFFDSGMNFDILKIRVMELVIILSRSAIEYGVKPRELLGFNYSYLTTLNEIEEFEGLCQALTKILENFILTVAALKNRKKIFEVKKMLEYIDEHFVEKITAKKIAEAAGLSVSRALHLFKEETGSSYSDYLKKARVNYGKYCLMNTDQSMAEIAYNAGFSDQSHFSKQFKAIEKMSPLTYRKKFKKG